MKKLLLFLFLFAPYKLFADAGDVTIINTISPKNYPASFQYVTRSTYVFVSTTPFSKNLGPTDLTVQHALQTLDQLTVSGGGSSTATITSSYGAMYLSSGAISVTNISTTPVKLSIFNVPGISSNTVVSTTAATITISTGGIFNIVANIISTGTGNFNQYFEIRVNASTTGFTCQDTPSARCVMEGIKSLSTNDVVSLYTNVSLVGNSTITATDAQLLVMSLGGSGSGGGGGGGGTPGGSNTNVQFNNSGSFGGDNGLQYDNSVSSITLGGKFGETTNSTSILLDDNNGGGDPLITLDDSNSSPGGGILFTEFGSPRFKWTNSASNFQFQISTGNSLNPVSRMIFPKNNQKTQITDAAGNVKVQFDPIGNSSFTIPVYLSTITINKQLIDSAGSVGTNGQVLTSNGSVDTWQTPTTGGGGSGSPLEVFSNFVGKRSSPTLSIGLDATMTMSVTGSTAVIGVNLGSTNTWSAMQTFSSATAANFYASTITIGSPNTSFPATPLSIIQSTNTYLQEVIQNTSTGTSASGNLLIVSDKGTNLTNYLDMGIVSAEYNAFGFSDVLSTGAYLYTSDHSLDIGTDLNSSDPNERLAFITGGATTANIRETITDNGSIDFFSSATFRVPVTFSSTTIGFFDLQFDAAQAKLPGSNSPYISNSTGETSASIYYDDTSTQSVTWSGLVTHYDGRPLYADIIFTSTATSGTINWGVYTDTETPNMMTNNYDTNSYSVIVTTSVTISGTSNSLKIATVSLSNTTAHNGDVVTFKLEREAGSLDTSVGFGRVKKLRVYE